MNKASQFVLRDPLGKFEVDRAAGCKFNARVAEEQSITLNRREIRMANGWKMVVEIQQKAWYTVISGGAPSPHPIQGIGAGFIPKNLKTELLDGVIQVDAEPAREYARRSAREEGLLVGISSGATLAAIAQKLPEIPAGATVLGFNYDTGERYLSVDGFLPS